MPWVPLTRFDEPPPEIVRRCREVIEEAPAGERATLLAVTQILTSLRYNDPGVLSLLGGREMMRESPLLRSLMDEAKAQGKADSVATVIRARFGSLPDDLAAVLANVSDVRILDGMLKHAADCADLSVFRARIPS